MAGNDWERLGDEIRQTVQDAIERGDYSSLNQTIVDALDQVLDSTMDSVSRGVWQARSNQYKGRITKDGLQRNDGQTKKKAVKPASVNTKNPSPSLYKSGTGPQSAGLAGSIAGAVIGAAFGMVAVSGLLAGIITGFSGGLIGGILLFALPAAAGFGTMGYSLRLRSLNYRFHKYVAIIGDKEYCDIKELAKVTGMKESKVIKDLEAMTKKGWFKQGHFDEGKTCFITSNRMYQQYLELSTQRKLQEELLAKEKQKQIEREKELEERYPPEVRMIIEDGDEFLKKIHACNDAIPGEEISKKIARMEMIVATIFNRVQQNPKSVSGVRKMMDYYLPTTIKLLEAYRELDAQPIEGENIQKSKQEIETTLDTINTAFEKILDDLFHATAWDVSTDISVLNTMLAQEGLKEEEWRMTNGQ